MKYVYGKKMKTLRDRLTTGIAALALLANTAGMSLPFILAQHTAAAASSTVHSTDLSAWDLTSTSEDGSAHNEITSTGLHVWTEATGIRKAAGYYATNFDLDNAADWQLDWTGSVNQPGGQLVVDLDNDGDTDGILVVENIYGGISGKIWLPSLWNADTTNAGLVGLIPHETPAAGSGNYANQGDLSTWNINFPDAKVKAIGYSIGSGITGNGTITKITVNDTDYTFGLPTPDPELVNIDVYYRKDTFKGIGVDIRVNHLSDATGVEVKVDRSNGGPVIKTNKSTGSVLGVLNTGSLASVTAPIVIQQGSYDEAGSSSWNQPAATWDSTTVPTSVTVTITREGGAAPLIMTKDVSQIGTSKATLAEVMPVDTSAPTFSIVSPANGSTKSGIITIEAEVTDSSDITKLLVSGIGSHSWNNGASSTITRTGDIFSLTIDTNTLPDGPVHVVLRGTDGAGNTRYWNNNSATRQHVFYVDNTAPTITWQLQPNATYAAGQGFHVRPITSEVGTTKSVYIDSVAPENLVWTLTSDHKNFDTKNTHNQALWDGLADGTHKFIAVFEDYAGNSTTSESNSFIIDRTGPTIEVKDGFVGDKDAKVFKSVSFALYDFNKVDKLTLNGVVKDLTDNKWSDLNEVGKNWWFGEVEGLNTLVVYDVAGNSTTYLFTLDVTAPLAVINNPINGAVFNGGTITVTGTVSDVLGLSHYNLSLYNGSVDLSDGETHTGSRIAVTGGWTTGGQTSVIGLLHADVSRTLDISLLDEGEYQIRLAVRDLADNRDSADSVDVVRFTVDKTAPAAPTITAPGARTWHKTAPIVNSWSTVIDSGSGISHYQIAYNYDDGHSFSGANTCAGDATIPTAATGFVGCRDVNSLSRNHAPTLTEQGGVTIWVRAIDNAGNVSPWSKSVHYYYDHEAPTTDINVSEVVNGVFTVSGEAVDNLALNRVYVQLVSRVSGDRCGGTTINLIPEGVSANWSRIYDIATLGCPEGEYAAHVSVVDMAGNSSTAGWTENFTVTNTPAQTLAADYFTAHADHLGVGFSIDGFDDATSVEVKIYDTDNSLITTNVGNTTAITSLLNSTTGQISSPFYIPFQDLTDGYWQFGNPDWADVTPAYAVVTIFYGSGDELSDRVDFVPVNQDNSDYSYAALVAGLSTDGNVQGASCDNQVVGNECKDGGSTSNPLTDVLGRNGQNGSVLGANDGLTDTGTQNGGLIVFVAAGLMAIALLTLRRKQEN